MIRHLPAVAAVCTGVAVIVLAGGRARTHRFARPDPAATGYGVGRRPPTRHRRTSISTLVHRMLVPLRENRNEALRDRRLLGDLPEVIELFALVVGAGLTLQGAWPIVTTAATQLGAPIAAGLRAGYDVLGNGGVAADAVERARRLWGPSADPLVHAMNDHLRYGTPLLPALERVGADARSRHQRSQLARHRRLPVLLLFPLVLCTLPAFGLMTAAPLVASTLDSLRGGPLEAPASILRCSEVSPCQPDS